MQLRLLAEAVDEAEAAAHYYAELSPELRRRFRDAFAAALTRITRAPRSFPILEPEVRRCQLRTFPYAVLFCARLDGIDVVAVMHDRREPGYWRDRTVLRSVVET